MRPSASGNPVRRAASEFPAITGLRFMPHGADAELVNISTTGLLAESTARLAVGSPVQVQFTGRFSPAVVPGRVARCEVACMGLDGLLRYNIGVEYDAPIELDEKPAAPVVVEPTTTKAVRNRW